MPLNKLDNFIKNTEGRILYVSPADLDSTDSIDNTGNSLARPFKTIQRALIESARFSYVKGSSNDLTERTTILLMPGDHLVDNRPGFKLFKDGDAARVIEPGFSHGSSSIPSVTDTAQDILNLSLETSFDLTQEDNILYKFNSTEGGVIVPRGTSIVGLDLRKTKIKPLYVPNPTDDEVNATSIFRITGACYFWQFSFFDGDENGLVYTDPADFTSNNKSKPLFSHHKLTCFEYADGVNNVPIGNYDTGLTDLDMYYAKLSNAYGNASGSPDRDIDDKYPAEPNGFAKQRPEWEIVGAFAADPISISTISAGDGGVPSNKVTVTTETDHNLTEGTPIKIRGVIPIDYNIATKVASVDKSNPRIFTYQLPTFRTNLETLDAVNASGGEVVIETDTVSGASPYIFNCSLRSVWGMNGMQADGAKADGFRSMVVAQFTGVSLQKDDRAFVKYDKSGRKYDGIIYTKATGGDLPGGSASTITEKVYHLDSEAIYRSGWEQTHIRVRNDAVLQIVSVFAIGYNKHFNCESGADASITNSNSNFGQLSLIADGFKKEAFVKDNKAFITNIFTPKSIETEEEPIDWLNIDTETTDIANNNDRLYIAGFASRDNVPPILTQGYRVGAKQDDLLYVTIGETTHNAPILSKTENNATYSSSRELNVDSVSDAKLDLGSIPYLATGEKVLLISDSAEYPENIVPHQIYYVIAYPTSDPTLQSKIALASTKTDADNGNAIKIYGGSNLKVISRVTDKLPGEKGHPVQWEGTATIDRGNGAEPINRWYVQSSANNAIYQAIDTAGGSTFEGGETEPTFINRRPDPRSLDEKIYKLRVVIPKELKNSKTPESGFIIQESSTTNLRNNDDFTPTSFVPNDQLQQITRSDYEFERNPRFISTCSFSSGDASFITEMPHNMSVGEQVIIEDVRDTTNTLGLPNKGYNGTFTIKSVNTNNMGFTVENNNVPSPSVNSNNSTVRNIDLPRYKRNDLKSNFYIYRNETIEEYIEDQQDGVYHIYTLRSDIGIDLEFTDLKYSQNVTDLYPQLDRDNVNDSPKEASSYALRSPIGDVHTSDLKGSVTRDTTNNLITKFTKNLIVSSSTSNAGLSTITFGINHCFGKLVDGTLNAVSGHNEGTYHNVKLYDSATSHTDANWRGATAKVVVNSSGNITSADITSPGSGYKTVDTDLFFDNTVIGGNQTTFNSYLDSLSVVDNSNDYIQLTGISTISDAYYKVDSVKSANELVIKKSSTDLTPIVPGHQIIHAGKASTVATYNSNGTVTTSIAHGLVRGNRFRFIDVDGNSLGDFIVSEWNSPTQFKFDTSKGVPSSTPDNQSSVLKHYMSANDEISDASKESIAARGNAFYGGDAIQLLNDLEVYESGTVIPESRVPVRNITANNQNGIIERFPIGTYIQIDDEIMRVAATTMNNTINLIVFRGALATEIQQHTADSIIKKINPLPVEFRRPSIIRASGHTFEYLGYGPGNYSTGLPQVQDRTLTEREEFLTQAQERSAGIVVYTGMNNKGDFYIGNTKKSSATGEETSFDTPIPTITGENAARLSAIFDEVTIKERIVVEGGDSGLILSQFDGPVTFNKEIRVKNDLNVSGVLKVRNTKDSTSVNNGALVVEGGAAITKNVNIGGSMFFPDNKKLYFGEGNDLAIYHDGTDTRFDNKTGDIILQTIDTGTGGSGDDIIIQAGTGKTSIFAHNNGAVELWNNGSKKFETISTGCSITGELRVSGDITAFYSSSDERLKDNVTAIDDPLAKVLSLSGYTFDWNENSDNEGTDTGVIAQEVEALGLPGIVRTKDNGYKSVQYHKLVPLLIGAVKELSDKVEALEQRLSK